MEIIDAIIFDACVTTFIVLLTGFLLFMFDRPEGEQGRRKTGLYLQTMTVISAVLLLASFNENPIDELSLAGPGYILSVALFAGIAIYLLHKMLEMAFNENNYIKNESN